MKPKLYILGPEGTFSTMAAKKVIEKMNNDYEPRYSFTIPAVIELLVSDQDEQAIGILPIENSSTGVIGLTQDSLIENDIEIIGEISIKIEYALVMSNNARVIEQLYTHSQAFEQCSSYITKNHIDIKPINSNSNIDSGNQFKINESLYNAAIVPLSHANEHFSKKEYKIISGIENDTKNKTRFLILRKKTNNIVCKNGEKTSLYFYLKDDKHSQLFKILTVFDEFKINLIFLHSRPNRKIEKSYVFFIDVMNNEKIDDCLKKMKTIEGDYINLGSYKSNF